MKDRKSILDDVEAKAKFPVPLDVDFTAEDEVARDYVTSDELTRLGEALIDGRGMLADLKKCNIVFLFKKDGGKSKGKLTLGKCQKPSGLLAYFANTDFIIWVAANHTLGFDYLTMEALVFHELKHAEVDYDDFDQIKTSINPHDWEGFADEVRIYGAWKSDIEVIQKAFQPTLFDNLVSESKTINHLRHGEVKQSVTVDKETVAQVENKRTKSRTAALPQS